MMLAAPAFRPITKPQTAAFWRLFSAAARRRGIAPQARDAWRHQLLRESCGVTSLSQVDRTAGFDAIMSRLAEEAGDDHATAHFSVAAERRTAALVADCATQCLELQRLASPWTDPLPYIAGILKRARLSPPRRIGSDWWLDIPPRSIAAVFQMLDTYRRRLLSRHAPTHAPAYVFGRRYRLLADGTLASIDSTPPPPAFFKIRTPPD